jgi:hypothetical protein
LEVPYRNRKSRAAELNWEFISTDHICSSCKFLTALSSSYSVTMQYCLRASGTFISYYSLSCNSHSWMR